MTGDGPTYTANQHIVSYDQHGSYIDSGPIIGKTVGEAGFDDDLTLYDFDGVRVDWEPGWTPPEEFPSFAELGIIGFAVEIEADGHGQLGFDLSLDNPNYPGAAEWPDGTDSGGHVTVDNYYSTPTSLINIDGPTYWYHWFAVDNTATDPFYEGNNYNGMLGKLEVSLKALVALGYDYNHVYGNLDLQGEGEVHLIRFDLVLLTDAVDEIPPVVRLYPRDDTHGIGGPNRLVPRPRVNRIIGRQP